jgi:hypothetical protein
MHEYSLELCGWYNSSITLKHYTERKVPAEMEVLLIALKVLDPIAFESRSNDLLLFSLD